MAVNTYTMFGLWKYNQDKIGVSRKKFVQALNAEGFPCFEAYVSPLYNLPIFKKKK